MSSSHLAAPARSAPDPTPSAASSPRGPRRRRRWTTDGGGRRQEQRAAYLFLPPWFIGLVFVTVGPVIASLYLSFTDYSIIGAPQWVGLDNYMRMFTEDLRYWQSMRVTAVYVFVSVPLVLLFALLLAVLLNQGLPGLDLYRALFYLPALLGSSAALALLWRQVFGGSGIVNQALALVGIEGPVWLGDPSTALITLIALHVWTFGSAMIIFLAGLRQIPVELYEAARIDGAGRVEIFFTITLPLLTPIILFNAVLNVITSFQAFTSAYVISGGTGGPANSTLFYTLYLYEQGFRLFNMGYASAMAWVLLLLIAVCTALVFRTSRYWVFYENDER